jgi:hypothetical protein
VPQVLARRTRAVERAFKLPDDAEACGFLLSRFWTPEGETGGGSSILSTPDSP